MISLNRALRLMLSAGLVVCAVIVGCSRTYDGREPAYDVSGNPQKFPSQAVQLIDGIESERLATFDQITEQFGELYMAYPELLGDASWTEVIGRVGARLRHRSDELLARGASAYARIAEYYAVAAQTCPTDSSLAERARLFQTWKFDLSDATSAATQMSSDAGDQRSVADRIDLLTRFALRDSLHFRFAKEYLTGGMFTDGEVDSIRSSGSSVLAAAADRALLAALGLQPVSFDSALVRFAQPSIEIPAVRLTPLAADSFRIEVYFLPNERVTSSLEISFWVETPDSMLPIDKQPRFPYHFRPVRPTSSWEPGKIAVGLYSFDFRYPISAVLLGLYSQHDGQVRNVPVTGTSVELARIPLSVDQSGI